MYKQQANNLTDLLHTIGLLLSDNQVLMINSRKNPAYRSNEDLETDVI